MKSNSDKDLASKEALNKTTKKPAVSYVLEPRVMLDAAAVATGVEAVTEAQAQDVAEQMLDGVSLSQVQEQNNIDELLQAVALESTQAAGKSIVIIDGAVDDIAVLKSGLSSDKAEVFVIDSNTDGLAQIAAIVQANPNAASLHIVSHGGAGSLALGEGQINFASLNEAQQQALASIGSGLLSGADILVYGCDFGAGERGKNAVETLAALTGADIAASDDRTGSVQLEADWQFEVSKGEIETSLAFNEATASSYEYSFLAPTDIKLKDSATGTTIGELTLIGDLADVDISASGTITRTLVPTAGQWTVGVRSVESTLASNGVNIKFMVGDSSGDFYRMVGLNATGTSSSFSDIDYAMDVRNNRIAIWENGSGKGTHLVGTVNTVTDVYEVNIATNGIVTYLKNDVVFYTSLNNANLTSEYWLDSSFYKAGSTIGPIAYNGGEELSVVEHSGAGQSMAQLSGVDADSSAAQLSYSIVNTGTYPDGASFTMGGTNNDELILTPNPDYDTKSSYQVRVQVTDELGGTYEKTVTVRVIELLADVLINDSNTNNTKDYALTGVNNRALDVGNFDDDGDMEIVAAQGNSVVLYDNTGSSTATNKGFNPVTLTGFTQKVKDVEVADLDGDGDMDIIALGQKGELRILWNDGTNDPSDNFTVSTYDISDDRYGSGSNTLSVSAGNFGGDGTKLDLAISTGRKVLVYEDVVDGITAGTVRSHLLKVANGSIVYALETLKTGGTDKIVYGTRGGRGSDGGGVYSIAGNFADQSTTSTTLLASAAGRHITDIEVVQKDSDQSGYLAVAAASNTAALSQAHVWDLGSAGAAGTVTSLDSNLVRPRAVGFTDMDGDGDLDLVLAGANNADMKPVWYRNSNGAGVDDSGTGTFMSTFADDTNPGLTVNNATGNGLEVATTAIAKVIDIVSTNITGDTRGTINDTVAKAGAAGAGDQVRGHGQELFFGTKTAVSFVRNVFNNYTFHDVYDLGSLDSPYLVDRISETATGSSNTARIQIRVSGLQTGDEIFVDGGYSFVLGTSEPGIAVNGHYFTMTVGGLLTISGGNTDGSNFASNADFITMLQQLRFNSISATTGDRTFEFLDANDNVYATSTIEVRPGN